MATVFIAIGSFLGFIIAYHTYGRWLAQKIFRLNRDAPVPSKTLEDGVDYVPSKRSLVFGHHFTSIAGTGPIVGPAIAVFWGWLPALIWVVVGSIFIGAVHDLGALIVSVRNRGQTLGEVAGRVINARAKYLFLILLAFALTVVLAIFGLVIAGIFDLYPQSVLAVWVSLPLAIMMGWLLRCGSQRLTLMALISTSIILLTILIGTYWWPIVLAVDNPVVVWTLILLGYCAIASVLPVWVLLQPRDYVNSFLLFFVLGLVVIGMLVAGFTGQADLIESAPAIADELPQNALPIFPFLFITIACGAVSGFHCLVSSGTSSKQISCETDAQAIGYGSMLLEGALAVVVIMACCAGIGMGKYHLASDPPFGQTTTADAVTTDAQGYETYPNGDRIQGRPAWRNTYRVGEGSNWDNFRLGNMVGAFVEGSANFLLLIGIPVPLGISLVAVLVACFAATTLDSATRLQRYVIQELAASTPLPGARLLQNRYAATALAVSLGGAIAMLPAQAGGQPGTGGLMLWPLFGATNQLLAGLAFLVTAFYLWRRSTPVWFLILPTVLLIVFPGWALVWQLFNGETGWIGGWTETVPAAQLTSESQRSYQWVWRWQERRLLGSIGLLMLGLQIWMVLEAILLWPKARGVLERGAIDSLTPLSESSWNASKYRSSDRAPE